MSTHEKHTITAECFQLVDKYGRVTARLTNDDDDNPGLILFDTTGAPRMLVGFDAARAPSVHITDRAGNERCVMKVGKEQGEDNPLIYLRAASGTPVVFLSASIEGGAGFHIQGFEMTPNNARYVGPLKPPYPDKGEL